MTFTLCPGAVVVYQAPVVVDAKFGAIVSWAPTLPVRLLPGEKVVVDGVRGDIWAGVAFTGRNGPRGWEGWPADDDGRWPLPGANIYSLIGFFVDAATGVPRRVFPVGDGTGCVDVPLESESLLRLGVNDQWTLDNDGAFVALVTVWRPVRF